MEWLNIFRIVGYVALAIGVICTVGVDILKSRQDDAQMNELMTDVKESKKLLEPFTELATKLYPGFSEKDALVKLQARIDSLDKAVSSGAEKVNLLNSELDIEKKTIKTFDVSVAIEFSGRWRESPYSQWIDPSKPMTLLTWKDKSQKYGDIEFSTLKKINFETINENTGLFKNTLIIQPGQFPLGQSTDILKHYDEMKLWIILTWPERLLDPKITFNKIDIVFSINGVKKGELHYEPNMTQDYSESLNSLVPGKANWLQPEIELIGKPVDILKMSI
jgi:hypothetical protein